MVFAIKPFQNCQRPTDAQFLTMTGQEIMLRFYGLSYLGVTTAHGAEWWRKMIEWNLCTHTIHGTGLFTYMNGWFLWYINVGKYTIVPRTQSVFRHLVFFFDIFSIAQFEPDLTTNHTLVSGFKVWKSGESFQNYSTLVKLREI